VRSVVVSGGSRGLGLAVTRRLAADGFQVIALARRDTPELASLAMRTLALDWGAVRFWRCDLAELEAIPELVSALRREFGPLHGLVNNAGLGTSGILATMHDSEIARLIAMNVQSPILLTKYVVRTMMATEGSRIVNMSSIVAETGYKGLCVYAATKRSLARELGPLGITVNALAPGFIDTEMTRELNPGQRSQIARRSALQRMPTAEDVANLVAFLFSDAARNITGTVLTVDAGNTA
jgi:3-oxoacyl-[acyl-carrier protein] reductase